MLRYKGMGSSIFLWREIRDLRGTLYSGLSGEMKQQPGERPDALLCGQPFQNEIMFWRVQVIAFGAYFRPLDVSGCQILPLPV